MEQLTRAAAQSFLPATLSLPAGRKIHLFGQMIGRIDKAPMHVESAIICTVHNLLVQCDCIPITTHFALTAQQR